MYKNPVIRNIVAGSMLLLFAISATPKQVFHDVLTHHKHALVKFDGLINLQAAKNNFQCNWHDQPIKSPFTEQPVLRLQQPLVNYTSYISHYSLDFHSTELLLSSLRAPPSQG